MPPDKSSVLAFARFETIINKVGHESLSSGSAAYLIDLVATSVSQVEFIRYILGVYRVLVLANCARHDSWYDSGWVLVRRKPRAYLAVCSSVGLQPYSLL